MHAKTASQPALLLVKVFKIIIFRVIVVAVGSVKKVCIKKNKKYLLEVQRTLNGCVCINY